MKETRGAFEMPSRPLRSSLTKLARIEKLMQMVGDLLRDREEMPSDWQPWLDRIDGECHRARMQAIECLDRGREEHRARDRQDWKTDRGTTAVKVAREMGTSEAWRHALSVLSPKQRKALDIMARYEEQMGQPTICGFLSREMELSPNVTAIVLKSLRQLGLIEKAIGSFPRYQIIEEGIRLACRIKSGVADDGEIEQFERKRRVA